MRFFQAGQHSISARGFSILEILIVLGVMALLVGIIGVSFMGLNRGQAVDRSAHVIAAMLEEARSLTLSSKNNMQYGVHFEADEIVLFAGASYDPDDPDNRPENLHPSVQISVLTLLGGSTEVVFERLTGDPLSWGEITLTSRNDASKTRLITISETGVVDVI